MSRTVCVVYMVEVHVEVDIDERKVTDVTYDDETVRLYTDAFEDKPVENHDDLETPVPGEIAAAAVRIAEKAEWPAWHTP